MIVSHFMHLTFLPAVRPLRLYLAEQEGQLKVLYSFIGLSTRVLDFGW